jgi:hypothetical protein
VSRLSEERLGTIEAALREAGAVLPCPRCGGSDVVVNDGYIVEYTQSQLRNMVIGGDNRISCIGTVCTRCGYLAHHVIDILGGGVA